MAETSRPAEVTQASGLGHEWAFSWGGHRTRAWGGDHRVRPKEWQCPGQARGREETDSGLQPRPRGLGASGPSLLPFPVLDAPLTPSLAAGKEPAVPHPNATVLVFLLQLCLQGLTTNLHFAQVGHLSGACEEGPGCKRRIHVCFCVARGDRPRRADTTGPFSRGGCRSSGALTAWPV